MFVGHSQLHAMQLVCRRDEPQHHMPHQLLRRACGHLVLTSVLSQQPVLELLISVLDACWCIVVIIIIVWVVVVFPLVGITNWIMIEMLFARIPVLIGIYMHYVCVCTLVSPATLYVYVGYCIATVQVHLDLWEWKSELENLILDVWQTSLALECCLQFR